MIRTILVAGYILAGVVINFIIDEWVEEHRFDNLTDDKYKEIEEEYYENFYFSTNERLHRRRDREEHQQDDRDW